MGERRSSGETAAPLYCRHEVIRVDRKFVQTEAYIGAQCKGSYKKNAIHYFVIFKKNSIFPRFYILPP